VLKINRKKAKYLGSLFTYIIHGQDMFIATPVVRFVDPGISIDPDLPASDVTGCRTEMTPPLSLVI